MWPLLKSRNCGVTFAAMRRMLWIAVLLVAAPVQAAEETPEDALAACAIGKAAVLMNQSADIDTAFNVAWAECKPLADKVTPDNDGEGFEGLDGIEEFVYMVLIDIAD